MFKRRKELIQEAIHDELETQIEGLINIEVGNYLYESKGKLDLDLYIEKGCGIDVYVFDRDFAKYDDNKRMYFKEYFYTDLGAIDDLAMVGHYHYDDLLYLILNFDKEKKSMRKRVDTYIKWKEEYISEKDKK